MIKKIVVIITIFISIGAIAQNNSSSPYSFFAIGDKNASSTVEQESMGGIGAAFNDEYHLNLTNPAANSRLFFTTYAIAFSNKRVSAKNSTDTQNGATTDLSYLALGVPLSQKGGMSFGLLPNSSVGYSLNDNIFDGDGEFLDATNFRGSGGTNKVFLGIGFEVLKNFSLGLQANYIFGKIENNIINQVRDAELATKYQAITNVKGYSYIGGFQYKSEISEKINLHLGGSFELENDTDTSGKEYLYSVSLGTTETPKDTILNISNDGIIKSPLKSTLGIGIGENNKWLAEIDYSFQNPLMLVGSTFENTSKIAYDKYSKFALGGFYTPKFNSITSYWERVTYRAGLKFEKTGIMVDGSGLGNDFTPIDNFGISFGVGLPVGNQLSNLNIGFEIGKRGETNNGLIQENYFNFRVGLSMTDKWFKKRRIF
jgi:hypothetical protein